MNNKLNFEKSDQQKQKEFKPIWETNKITFGSKLLFICFVISLFFEIIGKKTNNDELKTSHFIRNLAQKYYVVLINFGYYLAKFSDVLYFVQRIVRNLYDLIYPIFESIYVAMYDIANSLILCIMDAYVYFFAGYNYGIEGVYDKFSSYGISWILLIIGPILLLSVFESIGIKLNINKLRPTYYVIGFANNVYYFIMVFAYLYGMIVKVITRFNEVIYDILEYEVNIPGGYIILFEAYLHSIILRQQIIL